MSDRSESADYFGLCKPMHDIADVIGQPAARSLLRHYLKSGKGGHRGTRATIYVPKTLKSGHRLIGAVGPEVAEKLIREFGGENFNVTWSRWPTHFRDESIRRQAAEGVSNAVLACVFDMTERHIRNITRGVVRNHMPPANDNPLND